MPDIEKIQPLATQSLADYHVHCDFSCDASGTIDEYCAAAVKRGLVELCFTTHFDPNSKVGYSDNFIQVDGERVPATIENLKPYVDAVLAAKDDWMAKGLLVKLGVEYGWFEECESQASELFATYPFENRLCGIHTLKNRCFCSSKVFEENMKEYSMESFVAAYFEQATAAAKCGLFDTIAHVGYYVRHGHGHFGDAILTEHRKHIETFFEALVAGDTALEINTSASRHGFDHFYPMTDVINAAKKAGVRIAYLGSDAHRPEQVGWAFDEAAALAPETQVFCDW